MNNRKYFNEMANKYYLENSSKSYEELSSNGYLSYEMNSWGDGLELDDLTKDELDVFACDEAFRVITNEIEEEEK